MVNGYKLVRHGINNISHMEEEVNQLIEIGWQPIGVVNMVVADKQTILIQHMERGTRNDRTNTTNN
ncbi:MAG: hypothetical protein CTY12_07890 [Methylotenera sp.]|nr:MAG: hypothetical protein CTY12_07890 [Methylotenera sp.]